MMNEKLAVSLIIPAYNEEVSIGSCLEHAIKNSHGRFFEIIVIDNASTDRPGEIARGFEGVTVARGDRKGWAGGRQRGFTEARGDILAFVDADTHMPPGWCERVQREFARDPMLACLSGPYIYDDIAPWKQALVRFGWWYLLAFPLYVAVG